MRTKAAALTMSVLLAATAACGGGHADDGAGHEQVLAMPDDIDTSDGLTIEGERIADDDLYEAAKKDPVVLYSGSGQKSEDLTTARFTAETGIDIQLMRMPTSKLSERVLSEHGANQLQADVVRVTDPIVAQRLSDAGVYVPYRSPTYDELAGKDNAVFDGGRYLTSYYSVYTFAYNSAMLAPEEAPKTWRDLLDPTWEKELGVVHAGAGGTVTALAAFHIDRFGVNYLRRLGEQSPRIFDTTSVQIEALARGEISAATLGFNSTYGAKIEGAPIELVVPDEGVSGSFNLMGLTPGGAHSAAAKVFVNWTMSKSGQKFAAAQGFVPARTDTPKTPTGKYQLPSADSDKFHLFTPEDAEKRSGSTVRAWNDAFEFTG